MENAKKIDRVMIFNITEHGTAPNEDGMQVLAEIITDLWPEYGEAEAFFNAGYELNDPINLAEILEERPNTDLVFLVWPDRLIPCKHGPGPDGTAMTINVLRHGAKIDPNATSWQILTDAIKEYEGIG